MAKSKLGYMSTKGEIRNDNLIKELFKGEVQDKPVHFPKGLGAEHPFSFEDMEKVYSRVDFVSGSINQISQSIIGDFAIKLDNENAQALIDDFVERTNFLTVIEAWIREGLIKGNGFIELDLNNTKEAQIRVLNANNIYVRRNKVGKVLGYNQFTGDLNKFNVQKKDEKLMIPFKPNQIAHLPVNKIPNDPYGIGKLWTVERVVENIITNRHDLVKLGSRKAGAPYHFKVGKPGENTQKKVVDDVKNSLTFLNNRTEWVTDGNVDIKMLAFNDLGKNLIEINEHLFRMYLAGMELSEVDMGSGQLNEGIANVQENKKERMIKSFRTHVQKIIEEKIIRPILNANKLDEVPRFEWNLPTQDEINDKISKIKELLSVQEITAGFKASLEIRLAEIMELEDLDGVLLKPSDAQKKADEEEQKEKENAEREMEANIPQPEVPGAKPAANQKTHTHLTESKSAEMSIEEFVNLQEIAGFNYTDYLVKILSVLNKDEFTQLKGITEKDFANGLLTKNEIEKLKLILKDGFKDNKTIKQIESEVGQNVEFKDRIKNGKIVVVASARPNMVVRTETVRIANKALVNLYDDNNIKKYRWLAALSERTCPLCEALNGQVFTLNESQQGVNLPPLHANCRCSIVSVVE